MSGSRPAIRARRASRRPAERASDAYCPRPYPGSIVYFRAAIPGLYKSSTTAVWRPAAAELLVKTIPGHRDELVRLHAPDLARVVTRHLPSTH